MSVVRRHSNGGGEKALEKTQKRSGPRRSSIDSGEKKAGGTQKGPNSLKKLFSIFQHTPFLNSQNRRKTRRKGAGRYGNGFLKCQGSK